MTQFDNLKISDDEILKLVDRFGEAGAADRLEELSDAIAVHGYKYKSHYRAVLVWDKREQKRRKQFSIPAKSVVAVTVHPVTFTNRDQFFDQKAAAIHTMFKRDFERGLRQSVPTLEEIRAKIVDEAAGL